MGKYAIMFMMPQTGLPCRTAEKPACRTRCSAIILRLSRSREVFMKRTGHFLALFLCAAILCAFLAGCAKTLSGTYTAETIGTGASYTFSGENVKVDILILGAVAASLEGTYKIDGDKITFTFADSDSAEAKQYSGTFDFAEEENGIRIGLIDYVKKN